MTLDEYQDEWEKDSNLDVTNILEEIPKIPLLHAKYSRWLSNERLLSAKMQEAKKKLYTKLEGYYSGSIDGRDIGREPFQQIIKTNDLLKKKIEADDEMIKRNLMIVEVEEKVAYLKEIIANSINQRNWHIRNYIDYLKFSNGIG